MGNRLYRLSDRLYGLGSGKLTLVLTAIFVLFMATVLPAQAARAEAYSGETGSPDTTLGYTPADLLAMAEAYGEQGRAAYIRARFTFDLVFPLVYGVFLTAAISWALGHALAAGSRWRLLNLAPIAGVVFDLLENSAAALVMARFPAETPLAAALAPIFSILKWFFVYGSFLLLGAGLLWAAVRWARKAQR